jgi:branched-chain amino acid transport system ATP-binding protein
MFVLEVEGLTVRFGGVTALHGLDLAVGEFEIVGIIGPNGAGKTTCFNALSGFVRPAAGRVRFQGRDITRLPVHRRAALGIGRTFQNVGLVKGQRVRENLLTAQHRRATAGPLGGLLGVPAADADDRRLGAAADRWLERLDLRDVAAERAADLPYGVLKRVELAAVLATEPSLLLLDEPTSGMGPEESEAFGDLLLELRVELGLTILVIEHHVPLVSRLCDHVLCLSFGELLAEGTADEVRADPAVVTAYLGSAA